MLDCHVCRMLLDLDILAVRLLAHTSRKQDVSFKATLCVQVPAVLASAHLALAEHAASPQEAAACVIKAIASADKAVNIDRGHAQSLVVKAESHAAAGQCAAKLGPEHAKEAAAQWVQTRNVYREALHKPRKLGACSERCTVRYNYACALCACGELDEAMKVLHFVAERDLSALQGAEADAELTALHPNPAFVALVQKAETLKAGCVSGEDAYAVLDDSRAHNRSCPLSFGM